MPTRDDLHRLIDTLPEAAIEPAQGMLRHMQEWPPQAAPFGGRGRIGGRTSSGTGVLSKDPDGQIRDGYQSRSWWEADGTRVSEDHTVLGGQELVSVERVRFDPAKHKVTYIQLISGPGGREAKHESEFDLP